MRYLLVLLLAAGCARGPAADHRIEPGARIGPVALGDARDAVHAALGAPTRSWSPPADATTVLDLWGAGPHPRFVVYYRDGRVVQVHVTDAAYATADGLTARTPVAEIKARYSPLMTFVNPYEKRTAYYDAVGPGITFVVTYAEDAAGLTGTTAAVMVHPPGAEVLIY